jgi:hypothetical protein
MAASVSGDELVLECALVHAASRAVRHHLGANCRVFQVEARAGALHAVVRSLIRQCPCPPTISCSRDN